MNSAAAVLMFLVVLNPDPSAVWVGTVIEQPSEKVCRYEAQAFMEWSDEIVAESLAKNPTDPTMMQFVAWCEAKK